MEGVRCCDFSQPYVNFAPQGHLHVVFYFVAFFGVNVIY